MQSLRLPFLLLFTLWLTACVTTEQKPFEKNISKEKELETRVKIGINLLQKGEVEMAIVQLKKALDIKPDAPRVYEILALAFEQVGEVKLANNHFKKMVSLDGDYTRGRANYASFLIRQHDIKTAYKQLQIVTSDIYYPARAQAFQQLGYCAQKLNKKDEVEYFYERALKLNANLTGALIELAGIHFENENYAKSQVYFDRYRQRAKPSSAEALLLGIKLSIVFEDKSDEASFAMALKNLYPRSEQYLEYIHQIRMK